MLPPELNPHPELDEIWEHYQEYNNIDWVIEWLQKEDSKLPPIAKQKRIAIAQTIKTQRLLHDL